MAISTARTENEITMHDSVALVVDDEPLLRHYTSTILRSDGYRVLEASGGAEAFRLAKALGGRLDLIVSDIQMPDGDGISLVLALAKEFPAIPCLLVSAFEQPVVLKNAGFLRKPFLPSDFARAIHRLMARQPAMARAPCGSAA
jgi:two-component system, cell cycle sensor histidine kinase and response regulator CckA